MKILLALLIALTTSIVAHADDVDVLMVKGMESNGVWKFDITVHHDDSSEDHHVDSVAIFTPDETLLGVSKIPMPSIGADHVTTQLSGVTVPDGVEYILIKGHCSSYGWTDDGIIIPLL